MVPVRKPRKERSAPLSGKPSLPLRRRLEVVSTPTSTEKSRRKKAKKHSGFRSQDAAVVYRPSVRGEQEKRGAVAYSTKRCYQMFKTGDPQECEGRGTSEREGAGGKRRREGHQGGRTSSSYSRDREQDHQGLRLRAQPLQSPGSNLRRSPAKGMGQRGRAGAGRAGRKVPSLIAPPALLHHLFLHPSDSPYRLP